MNTDEEEEEEEFWARGSRSPCRTRAVGLSVVTSACDRSRESAAVRWPRARPLRSPRHRGARPSPRCAPACPPHLARALIVHAAPVTAWEGNCDPLLQGSRNPPIGQLGASARTAHGGKANGPLVNDFRRAHKSQPASAGTMWPRRHRCPRLACPASMAVETPSPGRLGGSSP